MFARTAAHCLKALSQTAAPRLGSVGAMRALSGHGDFGAITPAEFTAHHISATAEDVEGNNGMGRYFLLPGSSGRSDKIARTFFSDLSVKDGERGHTVYTGTYEGVDVGVVSTGMGCPSVDIILTELIKLGVKRTIRVGSCGSMQPSTIRVGSVVIATGAVKDEGTSQHYAPQELAAVVPSHFVQGLVDGAIAADLGDLTYAGVIHSKDSLYAREFQAGPKAADHDKYMSLLRANGVIASEMEASVMMTLGAVYSGAPSPVGAKDANSVICGTICGVIGDDNPFSNPEDQTKAVDRAIQVALSGIVKLNERA